MEVSEGEVFGVVGADGFHRLVAAFYRQVPEDDVLGPMYANDDLAGAEARLRSFLVFRFGGPQDYLDERGHPRLRMRHAPFSIGHLARDRWVALMSNAIEEADLPPTVAVTMRKFFDQVATFLMNQPL